MARYRALRETFLAHECRKVLVGEEFETDFPLVNGRDMVLGDNLELLIESPSAANQYDELAGDDEPTFIKRGRGRPRNSDRRDE